MTGLLTSFGAARAKNGRYHERSQYCLRPVHRAGYCLADSLDAQIETTDYEVSIAKNVPVLWIDHLSIKGSLPGVRQALYAGGVFDFKEINRGFHLLSERT